MRQLQGNLPKACCRTPREVDEADDVHSCFFSKGVFKDALNPVSYLLFITSRGIIVFEVIKMLKIAIVDDNEESTSRCIDIIKSSKEVIFNILDSFKSGESFLKSIDNRYNIVILDIDMPKMDGFEVAKKIKVQSPNTLILFYTAHEQYVFKSFEFQPFRYIRKEMAKDELPFALKCAAMQIRENDDKVIILKYGNSNTKVSIDSIIFFEKFKHNIEISVNNGEVIVIRKTLDELMNCGKS